MMKVKYQRDPKNADTVIIHLTFGGHTQQTVVADQQHRDALEATGRLED